MKTKFAIQFLKKSIVLFKLLTKKFHRMAKIFLDFVTKILGWSFEIPAIKPKAAENWSKNNKNESRYH